MLTASRALPHTVFTVERTLLSAVVDGLGEPGLQAGESPATTQARKSTLKPLTQINFPAILKPDPGWLLNVNPSKPT